MTISKQVEELEKKYELAQQFIEKLNAENFKLRDKVENYKNCCKMVMPNKVYTHKKRKNTTVKFLDGSSQTVTRRAGEKDCIETAIAYCILKQLLTSADLKKLIKDREEH